MLGAQKAAIAAVKPGMRTGRGQGTLQQIAYDYINTHGKDLHGQPLGQYFIHGLSHYVGLNVHDPGDYDVPLAPGVVFTIAAWNYPYLIAVNSVVPALMAGMSCSRFRDAAPATMCG